MILAALVDGEGDHKALLGRIIFAHRRHDTDVGIAMFEIEPSQKVAVGLNTVGIIDVGRLQEAEPIALRRLDDVLQPAVRESVGADKYNILHAGFVAFGDLKHQIDAVVGQIDDLGHDRDVETPAALIDFDDPLHVGLYGRLR